MPTEGGQSSVSAGLEGVPIPETFLWAERTLCRETWLGAGMHEMLTASPEPQLVFIRNAFLLTHGLCLEGKSLRAQSPPL